MPPIRKSNGISDASELTGTLDNDRLDTGIPATKLADGSVSDTEFEHLDGVTSPIQTQIDGKASTSHTHTESDITDLDKYTQSEADALLDAKLDASDVLDEDDFSTDSATKPPSQQSVKQYVADNAGGGGTVQDPTTKAIKVAEEVGTTGNARGTNAVDLQVSRNNAIKVASGTSSFSVGENCTASGITSTASGFATTASGITSTASGNYTTASGFASTASGIASTASGNYSTASGQYSIASGSRSTAYLDGQFANSSERITIADDSQYSFFVVREKTTNATPIVMTLGADGTLVRAVLPSGKTWRFVIELVAKNTSNGDTFAATYVGAIKRVGSTTSLVGSVTERDKVNDAGASTWSVAVTADDTNESLKVEVTGEAAKTINWCAVVHLTEVA